MSDSNFFLQSALFRRLRQKKIFILIMERISRIPIANTGGASMIVKTFSLTTLLLLSGQAMGQSTIETSLGNRGAEALDYIAKHFSASYHGEFYGTRRDINSENKEERKIKDFKMLHSPTIVYKPTDNWQALATAEFKFSDLEADQVGAGYPNAFYRGLFTLTRKNILEEKTHGVKLDLGIGRRQFNTGANQRMDGKFALPSYGNNRAFATLSKTLGKADTSLFVQYLHNDFKKSSASTWKHSIELIPTINIPITSNLTYFFNDDIVMNTAQSNEAERSTSITHEMNVGVLTYQVNDKISTYYQLKYLHNESFKAGAENKDDSFENYAGVTYAFTPKQSVTFELGNELARARDGRDGFSKNVAYPELALYVDLAI